MPRYLTIHAQADLANLRHQPGYAQGYHHYYQQQQQQATDQYHQHGPQMQQGYPSAQVMGPKQFHHHHAQQQDAFPNGFAPWDFQGLAFAHLHQ